MECAKVFLPNGVTVLGVEVNRPLPVPFPVRAETDLECARWWTGSVLQTSSLAPWPGLRRPCQQAAAAAEIRWNMYMSASKDSGFPRDAAM